ncbi:MAG: DNA polymerase III subunit gamma/tau [Planctomycetota bacterium]|nr:DNA polymerase III subunit gamma/tau [Planctomycetota bacterium]
MSYLVLARKYRPRTFADLVGQEVVARTLQGAIEEDRVGHAYLFCGPRGTGKTTTARIVAKALNCVQGPTPNPCGVCDHCTGIDKGSDPDLIEMDAASNRRIEDVRELRENVAYAPMRARYKIYIVDEVHMMTKEAFNALLKTLEEPPKHVKFLLATTDPQKVPATILSRCQILRLSPLPEAVISARLEHVFAKENVRAEAGVSIEIARRARGGMRDALSLADQLLSLVGSEPKVADLERLAAEGGADLADRVLACLAASDRAGVIEALPQGEGGEPELVAALLDRLRAILLTGLLGRETPLVQLDAEERTLLAAQAEKIGLPRIEAWIEELLLARERMARLPTHGRVVLEIALLDLARVETGLPLADLERRLLALEARLSGAAPLAAPRPATPARSAPDDLVPRPTPARDVPPAASRAAPAAFVAPPAPAAHAAAARGPAVPAASPTPTPSSPRNPAPAPRPTAPPPMPSTENDWHETEGAPDSGAGPAQTSDAPRPRIAGNADAWERFLDALAKVSSSLAETLRVRGKLVDLANGRALIQLANLRETERAAALDPQNQRRCASVFSSVLGAPTNVVLEDQAIAKKSRDSYTGKVAELFGGRIEDDA